jgi:hypothetical protein
MANNSQRTEQLTWAGSFCLFDSKLRSSGKSSIVWGVFNLLFGSVAISRNNNLGVISVILGLGLASAGIYQLKVRDPKVIIISAATLGGLALWNFALIALAAAGKAHLALGGRTLYWAVAQAWGAYAIWKTYSDYKTLCEKTDPITVEQVRQYAAELKKTKAEQSTDLVQFEVNDGFVSGTKCYRLKPVEDLYMVARYKSQLGSLQLEGLSFVPKADVTLTPLGEKWMSKKMKANVQLGPLRLDKVSITPEMAMRISPGVNLSGPKLASELTRAT